MKLIVASLKDPKRFLHPCFSRGLYRKEDWMMERVGHQAAAAQKQVTGCSTIRLLHTFAKVARLSTRIYQTLYDGSLAFLAVISPTENTSKKLKSSVVTH